jgi:hypothetical protein
LTPVFFFFDIIRDQSNEIFALKLALERINEYVHNLENTWKRSVSALEIRLNGLDSKLCTEASPTHRSRPPITRASSDANLPDRAIQRDGPAQQSGGNRATVAVATERVPTGDWTSGRMPIVSSVQGRVSGGLIATTLQEKKMGVVGMRASSVLGRQVAKAAKNIIDGDWTTYFQSERESRPWFLVQFKTTKVLVTHYALRGWGLQSPRSWVLEGADDAAGQNWEKIDEQNDCLKLVTDKTQDSPVEKFAVGTQSGKYFQCVRLTQTGKNHAGMEFLTVSYFEVFGMQEELR